MSNQEQAAAPTMKTPSLVGKAGRGRFHPDLICDGSLNVVKGVLEAAVEASSKDVTVHTLLTSTWKAGPPPLSESSTKVRCRAADKLHRV